MANVFFNLKINEKINEILTKIAKLEDRSKNKQIEYILKKFIDDYIKEHGDIK